MPHNRKTIRPRKAQVLGKPYEIKYYKKAIDVGAAMEIPLAGAADLRNFIIRIFDNDAPDVEVWHTILHELSEIIISDLSLRSFDTGDQDKHDDMDRLTCALAGVLVNDGWIRAPKGAK